MLDLRRRPGVVAIETSCSVSSIFLTVAETLAIQPLSDHGLFGVLLTKLVEFSFIGFGMHSMLAPSGAQFLGYLRFRVFVIWVFPSSCSEAHTWGSNSVIQPGQQVMKSDSGDCGSRLNSLEGTYSSI